MSLFRFPPNLTAATRALAGAGSGDRTSGRNATLAGEPGSVISAGPRGLGLTRPVPDRFSETSACGLPRGLSPRRGLGHGICRRCTWPRRWRAAQETYGPGSAGIRSVWRGSVSRRLVGHRGCGVSVGRHSGRSSDNAWCSSFWRPIDRRRFRRGSVPPSMHLASVLVGPGGPVDPWALRRRPWCRAGGSSRLASSIRLLAAATPSCSSHSATGCAYAFQRFRGLAGDV
jgi:hypothetical protein